MDEKPVTRDEEITPQGELEKLPKNTFRKSLRPIDELVEEAKKEDNNLTMPEKRLLDRLIFEQTGKHLDEFKKKEKPLPDNGFPSIGKGPDTKANAKPKQGKPDSKKAVKLSGGTLETFQVVS